MLLLYVVIIIIIVNILQQCTFTCGHYIFVNNVCVYIYLYVYLSIHELAEYVNMKVPKNTKMLQFWCDNSKVLPNMSKAACRVLCIPASSVANERVFSTAGRLLEKHRTTLSPNTVNNLLFLHICVDLPIATAIT